MDPTSRFSDRVADYVRHRPTYPAAALDHLEKVAGLRPTAVVADVGAGTGILTRLLLERGAEVVAVEPNAAMREALESELSGYPRLRVVDGRGEATGLPAASCDLAVAAQAFHWFDPQASREEFRRILRPAGHAALIWNVREVEATPFMRNYEALVQEFSIDRKASDHRHYTRESLETFFGGRIPDPASFPNVQVLDFEGLQGRLLSSSYSPREGDPRRASLLDGLRTLFDSHHEDGVVRLEYRTRIFSGAL